MYRVLPPRNADHDAGVVASLPSKDRMVTAKRGVLRFATMDIFPDRDIIALLFAAVGPLCI
jgi:hypothetical protein